MITDCTSSKRHTANCLEDRHVTYSSNPAPGNKPICIGHEYSIVAMLPSDQASQKQHGLLPLSSRRVKRHEKGNEVGMQQIRECIEQLSLSKTLVISLAETHFDADETVKKIIVTRSSRCLEVTIRLSDAHKFVTI